MPDPTELDFRERPLGGAPPTRQDSANLSKIVESPVRLFLCNYFCVLLSGRSDKNITFLPVYHNQ